MIDALRAFSRHLRFRCGAQVSTAAGLQALPLAGMLTFWLIIPPGPFPQTNVAFGLVVGFILAVCGEMLFRTTPGMTKPWRRPDPADLPVPTLPLGRRARAAAETLAALTCVLVLVLLLVVLAQVRQQPIFAWGTIFAWCAVILTPRLVVFGSFLWASACVPKRTYAGRLVGGSIVCVGIASAINVAGLGWRMGSPTAPESVGPLVVALAALGAGVLPRWERVGFVPSASLLAPSRTLVPYRASRSATTTLRHDLMRGVTRSVAVPGGMAVAILALLPAGELGGAWGWLRAQTYPSLMVFFPFFVWHASDNGRLVGGTSDTEPLSRMVETLPVGLHTVARYVLAQSALVVLTMTAMAYAIRFVALLVGNVAVAETWAGYVGSLLMVGPALVAGCLEHHFGRPWLGSLSLVVGFVTVMFAINDPGLPSIPFFRTPFAISAVAAIYALRHTRPTASRRGATTLTERRVTAA